jgi:NAD(P)-dependent dehydrogenase (short-subunit alcohol dehydrogenase family)
MHASGGEPNRVERVKASVPMKRGGRPDEVAQAIVWLLSDAASFTTGAFLDVAGGR